MTIIPYLIYLLLVALHVVILKDVTTIYAVPLNLSAFLVLAVTLYKDDVTAIWFGFFAGLVMAASGPPSQLGWQALVMASLALVGCYVKVRLNLDSLKAKLIFVLGGIFLHNLAVLIISRTDGFFFYVVSYAITGAIYTTVIAWFFFMIKEKRITAARVKALF